MRNVVGTGRVTTLRVEEINPRGDGCPGGDLSRRGGTEVSNGDYAKSLGESLRRIRVQKGMSLQDVQQASDGKWKAAVVGAYERGDRNVTVARLSELALFYGVPVSELLPDDGGPVAPGRVETRRRVVLDLEGLQGVPESERDPLSRFTTAIQIQRGDFNGRVLTIREDDLMALALLYQTTSDELSRRLADWGLLSANGA
jgi:transcriptional regulator with XRE-family HTH domain